MKTSQSNISRIQAVMNSTTNPAVKVALERGAVFVRNTNGEFVQQLRNAKNTPYVEGSGTLAGPTKQPIKKVEIKIVRGERYLVIRKKK